MQLVQQILVVVGTGVVAYCLTLITYIVFFDRIPSRRVALMFAAGFVLIAQYFIIR